MFKLWCLTLIVASVVLSARAYKNNAGSCARVAPQPNFDMQKMMGDWYVIEATSTSKKCLTNTFSKELLYSKRYLLTEIYKPSSVASFFGAHRDVHRTGVLKPLSKDYPAVMSYKHPSELWTYTFTVLMTDYDNYAVIYACKKLAFGLRRWSAMILSRTPTLIPEIIRQAKEKLYDFNIELSSLNTVDHAHCGYKIPKVDKMPPSIDETLDEIFRKNEEKFNPKETFMPPPSNNLNPTVEDTFIPPPSGFMPPLTNNTNRDFEDTFAPFPMNDTNSDFDVRLNNDFIPPFTNNSSRAFEETFKNDFIPPPPNNPNPSLEEMPRNEFVPNNPNLAKEPESESFFEPNNEKSAKMRAINSYFIPF